MTKRMIALITQTDNFISLPPTTKCLYYELALSADKKGYAQNISRICSWYKRDDLNLLISRNFIKLLQDGSVYMNIDIKK